MRTKVNKRVGVREIDPWPAIAAILPPTTSISEYLIVDYKNERMATQSVAPELDLGDRGNIVEA